MALGRADPHRLGRVPGLLAPRHAARGRRRRRHVPQRLRRRRDALHARARGRDPAQPRQRHRDVPRPRAAGRASTRARAPRCREAHDRVGAPPAARRARAEGQLALRDQPGRHRPRAPPPLGRGAARARLRRQRDRRPRDRRGPRRDVRDDRLGHGAAPRGKAALLHGDRRRRGHPRGDRGRRRHVRLRAADAHRAHRQRDHLAGPAQPAQRALRPRPAPARRGLRLPGVHDASRAPTSAIS